MRSTTVLLEKLRARAPQNEKKVPFKEVFPLRLKDSIEGMPRKAKQVPCVYEMSLVFGCFKDNNFQQELCHEQIKQFKNCVTQRQGHQKMGGSTHGSVNISDSKIKSLLHRYPNV